MEEKLTSFVRTEEGWKFDPPKYEDIEKKFFEEGKQLTSEEIAVLFAKIEVYRDRLAAIEEMIVERLYSDSSVGEKMEYTTEQVLAKAKERGYIINMHPGDRSWYGLMHERYNISLQLYPEKNEFELAHFIRGVKITSEVCGAFMDDKHFKSWE